MDEQIITYGFVMLLAAGLALQLITRRAMLPGVNPERDQQVVLYWFAIALWTLLLVVGLWKAAQPLLYGS